MKQQIVSRWNSSKVLFECEVPDDVPSGLAMRHALEKAVAFGASLVGARLVGASLVGARLDGARLDGASLVRARLDGACLDGASLVGARLVGASLVGASLDGARLDGACLDGASLVRARLDGACLDGASLVGARLDGARLDGASLVNIKVDFFDVLLRASGEVAGLRSALVSGKVDGSTYEGECACLVGSIANVRQANYRNLPNKLKPNAGRPAERWFLGIGKGDTPETNQISRITVEWLDEFVGLLNIAKAAS